jgi:hypothetical protein
MPLLYKDLSINGITTFTNDLSSPYLLGLPPREDGFCSED